MEGRRKLLYQQNFVGVTMGWENALRLAAKLVTTSKVITAGFMQRFWFPLYHFNHLLVQYPILGMLDFIKSLQLTI